MYHLTKQKKYVNLKQYDRYIGYNSIGVNRMNTTYIFEYINENEFRKLERSLKKYNMLAYKKLYFDYYPSLKEGNFLGEVVSVDKKLNTKTFPSFNDG